MDREESWDGRRRGGGQAGQTTGRGLSSRLAGGRYLWPAAGVVLRGLTVTVHLFFSLPTGFWLGRTPGRGPRWLAECQGVAGALAGPAAARVDSEPHRAHSLVTAPNSPLNIARPSPGTHFGQQPPPTGQHPSSQPAIHPSIHPSSIDPSDSGCDMVKDTFLSTHAR